MKTTFYFFSNFLHLLTIIVLIPLIPHTSLPHILMILIIQNAHAEPALDWLVFSAPYLSKYDSPMLYKPSI